MNPKHTFLLIAVSSALVSCAQTSTFGEQVQAEGSNVASIGQKWSDGEKMKLRGEKLIANGTDLQKKGRKMVAKGEGLSEKGQRMMAEAKQEYALKSTHSVQPAAIPQSAE